jgi:uncharacterized membrane protein (UPF0127 family)
VTGSRSWPTRRAARLLLPLALAPAACRPSAGGSAPDAGGETRVIVEAGGRTHTVTVEVADDDATRERGLMFRERLDQDRGMLFVFEEEGEHVFWMKDTLIPLDMIFVDGLGRVVGVVSRAEPRSLAPRSGGPSRYVLEVAGGWAEERGLRPGDRVRFQGPVSRRQR